MRVVCNSSPLISLSRAGMLNILKELFDSIMISKEVFDEVVVKGQGRPGEKEVKEASWIKVISISEENPARKLYDRLFPPADASTIALAKEKKSDLVIVDDKELRKVIKQEKLTGTGTVGVLITAKKEGLISNVKDVMDRLIKAGLRVDSEIYKEILKEAGE